MAVMSAVDSRTGIFISYRRSDAAGHAGRLFDWLNARRSPGNIFMDVTGIAPGRDFALEIDEALRRCELMLVVIGSNWATVFEARRNDANDWVRIEIEQALKANVRIIPVLVGGAKLPAPAQLPLSLAALARFQAIELSDSKWESDCALLWRSVKPSKRSPGSWLPIAAAVLIGAIVVTATGLLARWDVRKPAREAAADPARPPALLDPMQIAQTHGYSPLVVRSILAVLRNHQVPETAMAKKLDASLDLYRRIDNDIFGERHLFEDHSPTPTQGSEYRTWQAQQPVREEFSKSWEAAHRMLNEGRFEESASTLSVAADQLVSRRSAAALGRRLSNDAAVAYWLVGEIERLAMSPEQAVKQYELAKTFEVIPSATSRDADWTRLPFDLALSWAQLLNDQSDFAGAEVKYREGLQLAERKSDNWQQIEMLRGLAASLEARQRYAEAAPVRARALEVQLRETDAGHPYTQERAREYAATLVKLGHDSEARELLERYGLVAEKR